MIKVLAIVIGLALVAGTAGCWRSANTNTAEDTNVNAVGESPYANITDANQALAEGNRLLDENQTDAAIDAFKRAIEIDPNLAEAHFKLGIALSLIEHQFQQTGEGDHVPGEAKGKPASQKAFEKAVEAYKKWLTANPEDDVAHFNLARTYGKLDRDEEAEKEFTQAAKLKPDDTEYQTELGAIRIKLAKYYEAIGPLKKAIELDPTNDRAASLLEDAEAGRARVAYVSDKNTNQSASNRASNANVNANLSTNSNTGTKPPPSNVALPKPDNKDKKPTPLPTRPH
jgi:tetratricopeptide (TPR) repeat protein